MTPGLAGFIADGSDPQTWDDITSRRARGARGGIRRGPGARRQRGAHRRRPAHDLARHLRLAAAQGRPDPAVRPRARRQRAAAVRHGVRAQARARTSTQLVTGWQASRPHLLTALADGPVGARIAGLVAPRALIPVVTTSTATTAYRLLNDDGKTVARLLVERPSLLGPQPGQGAGPQRPVPLPARLTITEVRGYQGQARRAARLIAAVPGVRPAAAPLFADALARHRPPPGRLLEQGRHGHHRRHARRRGGGSHPAAPARHRSTRTCRASWPTSTRSSCTTCGSACGGPAAR